MPLTLAQLERHLFALRSGQHPVLLISSLPLLFAFACAQSNSTETLAVIDSSVPSPDASADGNAGSAGDAGDDDVQVLPKRCVGSTPTAPSGSVAAPLPTQHAELWRKKVGPGSLSGELVLANDRLAYSGNRSLVVVDRQGNPLWEYLDPGVTRASPAVADREGNLYYATSFAYSFKPDGQIRWKVPLGPPLPGTSEMTYARSLLLSPDGHLYFAASDGYLYRINKDSGYIVWRKKVGLKSGLGRFISAGVGDTLFEEDSPYATVTGEPSQAPTDGTRSLLVGGATWSGMLASSYEPLGDAITQRTWFLDWCMNPVWRADNTGGSWQANLVRTDGSIAFTVYPSGSKLGDPYSGYVYSSDGKILLGPKPTRGTLMAAGADGTMYSLECTDWDTALAELRIHAYSPDLDEQWSMSLGQGCIQIAGALADDGVLYVVRPVPLAGVELEMIAIQTTSPGLAKSAMPTRGFNNRRSGWLDLP